jgi:LEA14-like dessication related protein
MRKLSVLFAVMGVVALAAASVSVLASAGTKTHDVKVTVVSLDEKANTMTVKLENGDQKTVPVMGHAINKMKHVKAGEQITCVCTDNEKGEHQGISDIKAEHSAGAHKK